ncbi:unnamed protein product [Rotaria sp. Silwood1]|nr:unnamed protein product [Rotaria sp. Silwood1]CAF1252976.1 unnamed protein product [Rotaria sp. Silwood1]CAF3485361.1 unnamed protein product [Rotaria sp. Silwood1]CAF3521124.1 unnamed protein product [Rotaria sp. Silwood1]CAF4656117.1 unnamed protein product [Rotaria sp. Silwood1]
MDKNHLRGIILKLQDYLSDNDRQRLHFFLGDSVPRQIRDDQTLSGTLKLMESLLDQDKINESDVTFLINAFDAIQCIDGVKLLNEHMKWMQSNPMHKSTQNLSPIVPSFIDQVIMDQEDKNSTQTCIIFIKAGQKFGGTSGDYFDDSFLPDFTCHHLSGITTYRNDDRMESYEFSYSSDDDNHNPIESQTHDNQNAIIKTQFEFDNDEKIERVEGQLINENIVFPNGTNITTSRITGLQFFSTKGRASPSYNGRLGETFTENFDGYTVGFVTGRSNHYINQLQFFWYRTENKC